MKNFKSILIGVLLIAVGVIFALNSIGITDIDVFFDGWWTLFIIIPCLFGLVSESDKTGPIIGLVIGLALLLSSQNIVDFSTLLKLVFPVILVIIGVKIIFGAFFKKKEKVGDFPKNTTTSKEYAATFAGQDIRFDGEIFEGATLTAAFGGINCDLRKAIIEKDVFINASAAFGGIDIFLPDNVNVKIKSSAIFGGVSDKKKRAHIEGANTVYINADAAFGGVDIK